MRVSGGLPEPRAAPRSAPGAPAGGAAEVARWMERHEEELRRHLAAMLGGVADADDVLQEVWITAHRSPPEPRDGGGVRAWLYRVATNAALDRLALERRRRCAMDGRRPDIQSDPAPRPDAALDGLGEEGRRRVREEVAALPHRQRQAVWLRWIEGHDYGTIASRLGGSPGAARANVYQGLKKLRHELMDVWKEAEA